MVCKRMKVLAVAVDSLVRLSDSRGRVGRVLALAEDDGVVGLFDSVPTVVAVHSVEAAHDGGNLARAYLGELCVARVDVVGGAGGRHVSAVKQSVDKDALDTALLRKIDQSVHMLDVAVHSSVGEQPHQVQGAVVFFCSFRPRRERLRF